MSDISMKSLAAALVVVLSAGCAGTPVRLGTTAAAGQEAGVARDISAQSCGFQLLLFIPIRINNRLARAYEELERVAAGDLITDVQVNETWQYGLVGTVYCTSLRAKAVRTMATGAGTSASSITPTSEAAFLATKSRSHLRKARCP